jgi:hypothetical protein
MNRLFHGMAGDKAALLYLLAGNLSRLIVPAILLGAIFCIWWLK